MKRMRLIPTILALAVPFFGGPVMAEDTLHIQDGQNRIIVRQSGDPSQTRRTVERRPGYVRVEQHNGNNSSVIIQQSGPPGSDDD